MIEINISLDSEIYISYLPEFRNTKYVKRLKISLNN